MAKSDTITAAISHRRAAQHGGIGWPFDAVTPLPEAEHQERALTLFAGILEHRPPDLWRKADVIGAAHLAIAWCQMDRITQLLEREGWLIRGNGKQGAGTGGMLQNPLLNVLQMTSSRADSLSRRLGLAGVGADARTVTNAKRAFEAAGGSSYSPPAEPGAVIDWTKRAREVS